jgi:predicted MPP superfamily phosphohydrolase
MKRKVIAAAAAAALLTTGLVLDSRYRIDVTEYSLEFESLPREFEGFRIALLSDLHGWSFGDNNARLAKTVRETQPDLIAICGDMASHSDDFNAVEGLLQGIEGSAPIYYINGNHEWGGKLTERMKALMEKYGARCLSNEFESFEKDGASIVICGAEDKNGPADMMKPYALAESLRQQHPEDFVLWLYHRNDTILNYPKLPVDLVLSGHAHGGIVRLPFVGGLLDVRATFGAEYESGVYTLGNLTLLVSRGLGNSVIIPRFLNRPELPVITLKSKS